MGQSMCPLHWGFVRPSLDAKPLGDPTRAVVTSKFMPCRWAYPSLRSVPCNVRPLCCASLFREDRFCACDIRFVNNPDDSIISLQPTVLNGID